MTDTNTQTGSLAEQVGRLESEVTQLRSKLYLAEQARQEAEAARQKAEEVTNPFALYGKLYQDRDDILTPVLEHEHQTLCVGAFKGAYDWWNKGQYASDETSSQVEANAQLREQLAEATTPCPDCNRENVKPCELCNGRGRIGYVQVCGIRDSELGKTRQLAEARRALQHVHDWIDATDVDDLPKGWGHVSDHVNEVLQGVTGQVEGEGSYYDREIQAAAQGRADADRMAKGEPCIPRKLAASVEVATCRKCGLTGDALSEFTSPHTGLCAKCSTPTPPEAKPDESAIRSKVLEEAAEEIDGIATQQKRRYRNEDQSQWAMGFKAACNRMALKLRNLAESSGKEGE